MPRALHIVVTIKADGAVMIVVLTGAVHLVNGSPSGLLAHALLEKYIAYARCFQVQTTPWFCLQLRHRRTRGEGSHCKTR
jgi:hypothetical protein